MKLKSLAVMAFTALALTACKRTDIREVMKNAATQQVDTAGYERRVVLLAPFNAVKIDCFADVTYTQAPADTQPRMEVLAPKALIENLEAKVTPDGKLVVETDSRYNESENTVPVIRIHAPVANRFDLHGGKCLRLGNLKANAPVSLALSGVGIILCDSLLAPDVAVTLSGAGTMDLRGIETQRMRATLDGAGHIYLNGRARRAQVSVAGAGQIDTSGLAR